MKTRSAKSKGQKLQKDVVSALREKFGLDAGRDSFSGDIQACLMGGSGRDIKLSPLAETLIPFDIECKNQETWSVESWFKQAVENTSPGRYPLLICKKNRYTPQVFIRVSDFLSFLGCEKDDGSLLQISFSDFLKLL